MAGRQSAAVDDGEPSGTAGRPMLEVLRHQKLEGVLASVVRYYGGINLRAGGLVRTYTDAIAQALKKCNQGSNCSPKNDGLQASLRLGRHRSKSNRAGRGDLVGRGTFSRSSDGGARPERSG